MECCGKEMEEAEVYSLSLRRNQKIYKCLICKASMCGMTQQEIANGVAATGKFKEEISTALQFEAGTTDVMEDTLAKASLLNIKYRKYLRNIEAYVAKGSNLDLGIDPMKLATRVSEGCDLELVRLQLKEDMVRRIVAEALDDQEL